MSLEKLFSDKYKNNIKKISEEIDNIDKTSINVPDLKRTAYKMVEYYLNAYNSDDEITKDTSKVYDEFYQTVRTKLKSLGAKVNMLPETLGELTE